MFVHLEGVWSRWDVDIVLTRGCMVGVEIACFYLALIRSVDRGKDCVFLGGGGLQLWDCLKTVCVCVHNVVLGAAFGKGLRVNVHMCLLLSAYYTL